MNQTLTMLKTQRDAIEYEDMDIPEMTEYIKHTTGQNDAYPAGLYVALIDGSLYHASFVPGPDCNALVKSWYLDEIESEGLIISQTARISRLPQQRKSAAESARFPLWCK